MSEIVSLLSTFNKSAIESTLSLAKTILRSLMSSIFPVAKASVICLVPPLILLNLNRFFKSSSFFTEE